MAQTQAERWTHILVTLRYSAPVGSVSVKSPQVGLTFLQFAFASIFSNVL